MKLRITALVLCLLMLTTLYGCIETVPLPSKEILKENASKEEEEDFEGYEKIDPSLVEFDCGPYTPSELTKGYEVLTTDGQRKCYELVDKYVWYVSSEKKDDMYTMYPITMYDYSLSQAQLHLVLSAYTMDHPEVFWLDSKFA